MSPWECARWGPLLTGQGQGKVQEALSFPLGPRETFVPVHLPLLPCTGEVLTEHTWRVQGQGLEGLSPLGQAGGACSSDPR